MNNSKKMFSSGEITKAAGITRKILANYESKGLIKPDEKEEFTGNIYLLKTEFTKTV